VLKEKSIIQSEGKAHNEDIAKVDTPKKTQVSEKAHKASEEKVAAEGKISEQKAAEIVEKKAKTKTDSPFPADGEINAYGFLHFRKAWLEDLGWTNGMPLKIEKNADGSMTLRKAV